jgi:hypothetical protein
MAQRGPIKAIMTGYSVSSGLITMDLKSSSASVGYDTTLLPAGVDQNNPGVFKWEDRSGSYRNGYPVFTLSHRAPSRTSALDKVQMKLVVPVLEVVAGDDASGFTPAPAVAFTMTFDGTFNLPARSSDTDRKKFYSLLCSLFASRVQASDESPDDLTGSPLSALITTLDSVY